ncbi:MAG: LPS export ABC transporter periplasmic protein LptC [Deltaproteobacteria bacterium]|jgi:LPS export ABC transporter protein LptC|nr:LPS export ABC transporter periplasmic protein LptC [Deltaproteobacteria bacterium]MCW8892336.1 LPS export ABC transporter periplasmic protein LptC [Deltaproteobacteria bacterium]MCW9050165.1 LPS export ABC transporter periplasmic protein LptC [Deltaproteobacteria bacterium]
MFSLKRLLALSILVSVIILGTVIWRHLEQQSPEEIIKLLPEEIDLALENLHYTQNEEGQRRWTLDADKAEYQRDSSQVKLESVNLLYYQTRAFGDVELTADQGQLDQDTQQIDVWGDVRITTEQGEELMTERLHYDDKLRRLSTAEPVHFKSRQLELTGTGLQVDIDQGRLLVKEHVWTLLHPAGRENLNK